ncbi:MAG: glycosyltransferase [Lacibacter sp.]
MQKPRLLVLLNRLSVGGPATDLLSVLTALSNDFTILLVAGNSMADEQSADFLLEKYKGFETKKIHYLYRSVIPVNDVKAYYQIKQIIQEFKPDIVHTHGAKPGVLGRWAAYKLNVPVILHTFHGHVFHSYFSNFLSQKIVWLERKLAKISSAVIAINEKLKNELADIYSIAPVHKIKLIRIGVETEKFIDADAAKRNSFRNEFLLGEQTVAVGIAGRLVPVKNHRFFIEVAEKVISRSKGRQLKFFIIGDGSEKAELIKRLTLNNFSYTHAGDLYNPSASFVFTSWRKDMENVYAGLDIVLLTSLNEGTPVSVMEAMASSKTVVSTNAGGIAELIENGKTGFICTDPDQMANTVLKLIESPELRDQIGSKAVSFALLHLSKEAEVAELRQFYLELTGHTNRYQ